MYFLLDTCLMFSGKLTKLEATHISNSFFSVFISFLYIFLEQQSWAIGDNFAQQRHSAVNWNRYLGQVKPDRFCSNNTLSWQKWHNSTDTFKFVCAHTHTHTHARTHTHIVYYKYNVLHNLTDNITCADNITRYIGQVTHKCLCKNINQLLKLTKNGSEM